MNKKEINRIAKKYDLEEVILFGSKASGEDRALDTDIAICSKKDLSPDEFLDLLGEFNKLLSTEKVDLVDLRKVRDLTFLWEIYSKGKLLFEKKVGTFLEKRASAFLDYHDFKRFYAGDRKEILIKGIKELTA